jgi:transcriptional regulator with XRE-family HTH domain
MAVVPYSKFSGQRLLKARQSANMSRLKLSVAINGEVCPYTIMRWERGFNVPNLNAILLVANVLGVSIREFTDADG